jgi:O-antigen/teichoic acid export membrane protein
LLIFATRLPLPIDAAAALILIPPPLLRFFADDYADAAISFRAIAFALLLFTLSVFAISPLRRR